MYNRYICRNKSSLCARHDKHPSETQFWQRKRIINTSSSISPGQEQCCWQNLAWKLESLTYSFPPGLNFNTYTCANLPSQQMPWGSGSKSLQRCHLPKIAFLVYVSEKKFSLQSVHWHACPQCKISNIYNTVLYISASPGYCSLLCDEIGLSQWENSQP